MKKFSFSKFKKTIQVLVSTFVAVLATASIVWAATNIGSNINSDGDLYIGGNVGIGTTPNQILDMQKSASGSILTAQLKNTSDTAASDARMSIQVAGANAGNPFVQFNTPGIATWALGVDNSGGGRQFKISKYATLGTNDFFTVNSSGYVGIGTATPEYLLHLSGISGSQATIDSYGVDGSYFRGRHAQGTSASPTATLLNDPLVTLSGSGYDGSAFTGSKAMIRAYAAENWTGSANGSYMSLSTTPIGGTSLTEIMRFSSAGNVGIGTNEPNGKLHVHETTSTGVGMYLTNSDTGTTSLDGGYVGLSSDEDLYVFNKENANILFQTNQTNNMVFNSIGNLGIGTTTPEARLQVYGGDTATSTVEIGGSGSNKGACLKLRDSDGAGWTYCTVLLGAMTCSTTSCE